ncbi:MAG: outer membrane protein assembly factor BamC [Methylococcaceae bacterium]|nr:outer membrane protein assembly factor BamC [Methylococcaceae bacterium]
MKHISFYLLIVLITSCGAPKEPTHSTVYALEQPPSYPKVNVAEESKENDKYSASDINLTKGQSSDVYRNEDQDQVLWIKRSTDDAWTLLGEAIRLKELEVTRKNRKQGVYEVEYKADSLFGGFSLFGGGKPSKYLLKLVPQNNTTKLSISKIEDDNEMDESILKDGAPEFSNDNSSKLADILFETLNKNVSD